MVAVAVMPAPPSTVNVQLRFSATAEAGSVKMTALPLIDAVGGFGIGAVHATALDGKLNGPL